MTETLRVLLSMSVSGGLTAVLLFALRPLLKNRAGKACQYYLCLVVLLRLILPFSPEVSLMASLESVSPPFAYVGAEANTQTYSTQADVSATDDDNTVDKTELSPAENDSVSKAAGEKPAADNELKINLAWLWLILPAGTALLAVKKVVAYRRFTKGLRGCCRDAHVYVHNAYMELCEELKIRRAPRLHTCRAISSPMLTGLFKPAVVLPENGVLNVRLALEHELIHYKRGDVFLKLLAQAVLCLHWFNPLVWLAVGRMEKDCELACDEAVMKLSGDNMAYGEMLVSAAARLSNTPAYSLPLSKDGRAIKERLESIMLYNTNKKPRRVLVAVVSVALACFAVFAGCVQPALAEEVSENEFHQKMEAFYEELEMDAEYIKGLGGGGKVNVKGGNDNRQQITIPYALLFEEGSVDLRDDKAMQAIKEVADTIGKFGDILSGVRVDAYSYYSSHEGVLEDSEKKTSWNRADLITVLLAEESEYALSYYTASGAPQVKGNAVFEDGWVSIRINSGKEWEYATAKYLQEDTNLAETLMVDGYRDMSVKDFNDMVRPNLKELAGVSFSGDTTQEEEDFNLSMFYTLSELYGEEGCEQGAGGMSVSWYEYETDLNIELNIKLGWEIADQSATTVEERDQAVDGFCSAIVDKILALEGAGAFESIDRRDYERIDALVKGILPEIVESANTDKVKLNAQIDESAMEYGYIYHAEGLGINISI